MTTIYTVIDKDGDVLVFTDVQKMLDSYIDMFNENMWYDNIEYHQFSRSNFCTILKKVTGPLHSVLLYTVDSIRATDWAFKINVHQIEV